MDKNYMIFSLGIFLLFIIGTILEEKGRSEMNISMSKNGLEQCPSNPELPRFSETIWVKSCKEYTELMRERYVIRNPHYLR
jgi:hypothetical protein